MEMAEYLEQEHDMEMSPTLTLPPIGTPLQTLTRAMSREPKLTPTVRARQGVGHGGRVEGRMNAVREEFEVMREEVSRIASSHERLSTQVETVVSTVEKHAAIHEKTRMEVIASQEEEKTAEQRLKTEMKDIKEEVVKGRTELTENHSRATKKAEAQDEVMARKMEEGQADLKVTMGKARERAMQENKELLLELKDRNATTTKKVCPKNNGWEG